MLWHPSFDFAALGLMIQILGSLFLATFIVAAWLSLLIRGSLEQARWLVVNGVIACLTLMTAATLARTITLRTWPQIVSLTVILSLRILLKRLFVWERTRLAAAKV